MSTFDSQWQKIAKRILKRGKMQKPEKVRAKYKTDKSPAPAKYLIGETMKFPANKDPILFCKKTYHKASIKELIWIWIMRSNKVKDLQDMGVKIWNEWEFQDGEYKGTIGPAYGFVLNKNCRRYPLDKINKEKLSKNYKIKTDDETGEKYLMLDQVDYLIQELINNPSSRRLITNIWDIDLLDKMFLEPCVYCVEWHNDEDDMLHIIVHARSQDFPVGTPFNVFQYRLLQKLIAQITNKKVGSMTYGMGNVHIYDRHIENVEKMISNDCRDLEAQIVIDPTVSRLQDFTADKYKLENYKDRHFPALEFEIAE